VSVVVDVVVYVVNSHGVVLCMAIVFCVTQSNDKTGCCNVHCIKQKQNIAHRIIEDNESPPTQCIYVFCVDLRTNSDYFPTQH